ncbi:MAG TPA: lysophospholipid acyltransferase family protein [Spirochaetota bacterium]|nr:1-acyl-sn-glycerol-3-phosphate acyltransferase [Spirochaetota bacterium]HOD14588.1 lysophospholipid acyltransferase family protein [Spirochaetota bacterium]HPN13156.1 lysophospholipid acyltransferase family protein [Spirochaetota bacterium]HQL82899.1 lysophospholipid acyltransferase family protein [Spirochaetota bacterium]
MGVTRKLLRLLYQPYRLLVLIPMSVLATCFFVALGVVIIFLFNDRVAHRTTGVWWSRFISYITPIRVKVIGRENIRNDRSYMVIANHQSQYDILVLYGWLGINIKWVMKSELRKVPVFGYAGEKGGNIYVDRSSPEALRSTLEGARSKIVGGTSIIMLPEGTRSRTGELGEFKNGAFVIARELNLPILPVTITGTRRILPPGGWDVFPGTAVMTILPPIEIDGYGEDRLNELKVRARGTILAELAAQGEGKRES